MLERLNLIDEWEKRFNKAIYSEGLHHHRDILENPKAAKFMWGEEFPILADIDALAEMLNLDKDAYSLCNIRFSIGAILFTRKSWQEMGYFPVDLGRGMGGDEQTICSWCMMTSKAIVVDENTIVGHLGYGPQTKEMMNFYEQHRENFQLKM